MKNRLFVLVSLIICLYFSGCSKNSVDDDVSNQKLDLNKTENYNIPNHGGPAITSVDTSDPEIDRQQNQNTRRPTNPQYHYNTSKIIVANRAADKVADLSEIDHAYIIVTDNNAYVAVQLGTSIGNQLTASLRGKITKEVKMVDDNIDNVYISKNPQFYKRMARYTRGIRNGQTSSDFIDDFSDTIRRVFPDAR
ncbi:YhcN/YlaJ family sporulation lipoprotein [Neobacillus cucumis]|uniref:YhcN/YlaJ family sporulation lipoprotein n=1 Tax=Neobacillus cucumis TaxID=1740721 RepID=UPI00203F69DC|nr:YhcN/YlaJ family sporulation lipoprotein [Neobacillus cucumis]MCM3724198.1 YhcN/YlaJ family sporulation lipoprotein [Neobacillus cucumis]